jgi:hypothetical protein
LIKTVDAGGLSGGSGTSGLVHVDSTQVQYQEEVRFRVSF